MVGLVEGHVRLLVGRGHGRLSAWPDPRKPEALERGTQALLRYLQRNRMGTIRVRQVNGEAVGDGASVNVLEQSGWAIEDDRLVLTLPP